MEPQQQQQQIPSPPASPVVAAAANAKKSDDMQKKRIAARGRRLRRRQRDDDDHHQQKNEASSPSTKTTTKTKTTLTDEQMQRCKRAAERKGERIDNPSSLRTAEEQIAPGALAVQGEDYYSDDKSTDDNNGDDIDRISNDNESNDNESNYDNESNDNESNENTDDEEFDTYDEHINNTSTRSIRDILRKNNISASYKLPSQLVIAEQVDQNKEYEENYEKAKEKIKNDMVQHAVQATELPTIDHDEIRRKQYKCFGCMVFFAIMTGIILGLLLGLSSSSSTTTTTTKPGQEQPKTISPEEQKNINIQNLQNLFVNISGDIVYDKESSQYNAIEWLTVNDTHYYNTISTNTEDELLVRYILIVLYFETNGINWYDNTNYLIPNISVCLWDYIICTGSSSSRGSDRDSTHSTSGIVAVVEEINIPDNNLMGIIPNEISNIRTLTGILMSNNNIKGTIPSSIGIQLTKLKYFIFDSNSLIGSIPSTFSNLNKLETLSFKYNKLSGTLPYNIFQSMKVLETLNVRSNQFDGTIPEFFINIKNNNNNNNTNSYINTFIQNGNTKLQVLDLWDNYFHGSIPDTINTLSKIEYLDFGNNLLTGTIPYSMFSTNSGNNEYITLYLEDNFLTGTIPSSIGNLDFLETFSLWSNYLNGTIPTQIGQLKKIKYILLMYNQFTGSIPTEIGYLSNLDSFVIDGNLITGTIPRTILSLTKFETLGISNTSIIDTIDGEFCTSSEIIHLEADCDGNAPEVNCTCCTTCCNDQTGICKDNNELLCINFAKNFANSWDNVTCACNSNNNNPTEEEEEHLSIVDCNFLNDCLTCNEDQTVCGKSINFGYSWKTSNNDDGSDGASGNDDNDDWMSLLDWTDDDTTNDNDDDNDDDDGWNFGYWNNKFTYKNGTKQQINNTFLFDYDVTKDTCEIIINEEYVCKTCDLISCADGFEGLYIDCTNINTFITPNPYYYDDDTNTTIATTTTGGLLYNSCYPSDDIIGSIFEVFLWMESYSWTGCPFVSYYLF